MRTFQGSLLVAVLCAIGACERPKAVPVDTTTARDTTPITAPVVVPADVPSYVAAKAAYISKCESAGTCPAMNESLKDLEARLRAIIGPVEMPDAQWAISLDAIPTRGNDGGAQLDGLMARVGGGVVIVTTPELLTSWIRFHGDSAGDPMTSLGSEDMLTQALFDGAHVYRFVDVAARSKLPKDVFIAQMIHQSQDTPGAGPDKLIVGVLRGGRIFLFKVPAAVALPTVPSCGSEFTEGYRYCYDSNAVALRGYSEVVKQIKALVALVPPG